MSATKVLDLAEKQSLLEPKVIADLRRQVADSKFMVTPEAIAKLLVDRGHLTAFQARNLVAAALGEPPPESESPSAAKPKTKPGVQVPDELTLADDPRDSQRPATSTAAQPAADDDIVILEAVSSAKPTKAAFQSPRAEPALKPFTPPTKLTSPPPTPPPSPPKAPLAATREEIIDLEPMPAPTAKGATSIASGERRKPASSWKGPPATAAPPAAESLGGLTPLHDVLTADPLTASDPFANAALTSAVPPEVAPRPRRNVWDSPLLLIGGGLLGLILVIFGLLYYSLTRGTAAEVLGKADEEYKSGTYASAIAAYELFLKKHASDPSASFARVRLGMAKLRQVADGGKNPRQALQVAQAVLPVIEQEAKFSEARQELSTILPDIADGFAIAAAGAKETAKKEELVKLADDAMSLVNNPSYLPASLRKDREPRIAAILDKLKVAQRSIEQDKQLAQALAEIAAAGAKGDAAAAYRVRADLLRVYPGLDANDQLIAAIRKIGDKEQELVLVTDQKTAAATDDSQSSATRLVLAVRSGPEPAAMPARLVFVLVEGSVYGIDADSGHTLWRRHVGYESLLSPQSISRGSAGDVLIADARRHELLRLSGLTGKVVWRQAIGQPFFSPVLSGERVFVTTQQGRVLRLDAASGEVQLTAQLPQQATVAAGIDGKPSRLVQLGQHSTIFLLDGDSLACTQTYYLGHRAGAILTAPVSVLDHLFVMESPADDHTLIHVLAPAGEKKQLTQIGRPFRLKGRVVMPVIAAGRRVTAVTDLGQIAIYEVDTANPKEPVRLIAGQEPSERSPSLNFYAADANRLWIASRRCSMFDIQASIQNLNRKWSLYQDDAFIAPLQSLGNLLVHVRRHRGSPAAIVTGCHPDTGKTLWETELAVPLAGLMPVPSRMGVDAITTQGRVFPLASDAPEPRIVDNPAFVLPQGSAGSIWPELAGSADGVPVVWTDKQAGGRVYVYDLAAGSAPTALPLPEGSDSAAAAAVVWGKNVAVPLKSGKLALLDLASGKPAALPFLPAIDPAVLPRWTRPAALPAGSGLVIADGRGMLYRLAVVDQPQPHLHAAHEAPVESELHGSLAAAGTTVYGIGRTEAGEAIVAIDPQSLAIGSKWPLSGATQFDLTSVQGAAFVATEADGLFCLDDGQKLRWQRPLAHGPLAGPPLPGPDGELLLLSQSGFLSRISAETGEEIATADVGEPLGRTACVVGGQVFVGTSDGSVAILPLPQ